MKAMFLEYFRLRQQPFGVTPDPAFLYPSRTFREALASLSAGIDEGRGFLALIAEPGMGKTTLLYHLFEQLRERDAARTALLFQTQCDSREFFQYLLSELGVDSAGMGLVAMHEKLNEMLFAEMLGGKRFVLVVDEAQNLTEPVLETVRLLSNFETSHTKLLQIILAGQPQLAEKLSQPRLAQLRQRIAVVARLDPLSPAETLRYIDHRLQIGGHVGAPVFAPEARERIALESRGIPRAINNICYSALAAAHAAALEAVTPEIVDAVVLRLSLDPFVAHAARTSAATAAASRPAPPPVGAAHPSTPTAPTPKIAASAIAAAAAPPPSELTYGATANSPQAPWTSRTAMLVGILIFAALCLSPLLAHFMNPWRATAASISPERAAANFAPPAVASEFGPMNFSFSADPEDTASGQVLTVVAGPGQTLEQISRAYIGHFDAQLLKDILTLNPTLRDPNHLEAGQLLLLPLPHGALTKGLDLAPEK
jgi:general secretion pathway protein A